MMEDVKKWLEKDMRTCVSELLEQGKSKDEVIELLLKAYEMLLYNSQVAIAKSSKDSVMIELGTSDIGYQMGDK